MATEQVGVQFSQLFLPLLLADHGLHLGGRDQCRRSTQRIAIPDDSDGQIMCWCCPVNFLFSWSLPIVYTLKVSVGSKMSDKRRTLEYDGITGANTANVSAYLRSPSEYQCLLRNRQHQPIAVINVQQRLQYSSPSSQRSVSARNLLEEQKHNIQRYLIDLHIALKQYIQVLIANMRRSYVPVGGPNTKTAVT